MIRERVICKDMWGLWILVESKVVKLWVYLISYLLRKFIFCIKDIFDVIELLMIFLGSGYMKVLLFLFIGIYFVCFIVLVIFFIVLFIILIIVVYFCFVRFLINWYLFRYFWGVCVGLCIFWNGRYKNSGFEVLWDRMMFCVFY